MQKKAKILSYTVVFEKNELGGYNAIVPSLNFLATSGDTIEEAQTMVVEAMELYLEHLQEECLPIPASDRVTVGQVAVTV